ncbi:MAG: NifB/NifX family molybdenum-iron cluster-binding protein [Pseudomonadota bacterium]
MNAMVAIPSVSPGGLKASVGDHYGNCDLYTLVRLENSLITEVRVIPNSSLQQEGWDAPLRRLAENGVKVLISGGIGMKPVNAFFRVGIDVYYGGGCRTVEEAVQALAEGSLSQLGVDMYKCVV